MLTVSSVVHKEWLEDKVSLDYYEFFADEDSDLPTGGEYTPDEPTDITYKIAQGSMGYVISTSTMYLLNSEGSWVEQESSGGGGGGGGTTNYEQLSHKPQINGTTLSGNKSLSDLGIAAAADIPSVPVQSVSKNGTAITPSAQGNVNITVPTQASDVNALSSDTKYAGSATQGGSAISAAKLDTASAGSTTQPVYFKNGVPTATTYSLEKSVPSNAVFTDTTYEVKSESEGGSAESLVTTGDIYSWNRMIPTSQKGANSGVATLDSSGKLVSAQLPLGSTASTAAAGNHTHTLSLASDSGTSQISLQPNTKYKLTGGGSTYVFTTPSDSDTTYTLAAGTGDDADKVVLTPSSGSAQKITVPYATSAGSASSASAVAWSGVSSKPSTISGYGITDAKIANGVVTLGANTITPLTSHQSVTDNNPTLAWGTKSKVATIGSTDINVTMPAQPSYTASDVGLGNVTNDAQVKKIGSSTSGNIMTWSGTTGDTPADSGVSIEASSSGISDSDAKIPTSKDIRNNIAGSAKLTGYAKTTGNVAASDTVTTAIGKLETKADNNTTNIGKIQTQANWNTNNGVKNLSQYNNGTYDSPIKISCNFKSGERYIISWNSITSTSSSDSSRICFMNGESTVSNVYYASHDTSGSTTLTLTSDCDSFWVYAGSTYEANKTVTLSNFMIRPATISDTTFQPYALPNTKITPELIELVDSGAKNLFLPTAESKTNPTGFTGTITNNGDGSYTINGTAGSSPYYLKLGSINLKAGTYVLYARPTQESDFYIYNDGAWTDSDVSDNRYATFATDITQNIYLRVSSNATVSNYTIYPMICTKAAWDVSQKFVPYRPTYEETVEQAAENENNILLLQLLMSIDIVVDPPVARTNGENNYIGVSTGIRDSINAILKKDVDYTVQSYGIIFCNDGTVSQLDLLKVENIDNVHILVSEHKTGTNLKDLGNGVIAVLYIVAVIGSKTYTIYSPEDIGGNFNEITSTSKLKTKTNAQLTSYIDTLN